MWNLSPNERLRFWQDFRKSINPKSLDQAVKDVQHLWSYAPFLPRYLTTDHVENWPTPWELVYENQYCDLAKALGIVYTLYLSEHKPQQEIRIYKNSTTNEKCNLVFVAEGKYVLNYIHDEVVNKNNVSKQLDLVRVISDKELQLERF